MLDVERFMNISFVNDVFIYCSGKVDVTGFPLLILFIFEGKGGGGGVILLFFIQTCYFISHLKCF